MDHVAHAADQQVQPMVNILRNHDELTLEMVTAEERDWMWARNPSRTAHAVRSGHPPPAGSIAGQCPAKDCPGEFAVVYNARHANDITVMKLAMGDNIWLDDRTGVRTPMQWSKGPRQVFQMLHQISCMRR